jgi:DNA polymerase I-like protein with 3'-5' exonuclease and polymerase domains
VHDELDISVKDIDDCKKIIEIMSDCVSIKVPNLVDAEIGNSWGTATKDYKEFFNVA